MNIYFAKYENKIKFSDIPQLRGAINKLINDPSPLFHNHIGDDNLRYSYPLIQYKLVKCHFCVMFLNDGVRDIHSILQEELMPVELNNKKLVLKVSDLKFTQFEVSQESINYIYAIDRWMPLKNENIKQFFEKSKIERIVMLKKIIIGNILSFLKGCEIWVDFELIISDLTIDSIDTIRYKRMNFVSINAQFSINTQLPESIGLGKGVSLGYGVLKKIITL